MPPLRRLHCGNPAWRHIGKMASTASLQSRFLRQTRLPSGQQAGSETVHDLRVLGKRLRACLQIVRPVLGEAEAGKWNGKISESARSIASARNAQVLDKLLPKLGTKAGLPALRKKLALPRSPSRKPAAADLRHFQSVLEETKEMIRKALPRLLPGGLRHEIKRSRKKVAKRGKKARGHDSGPLLHQWRKSVKRLLYQLELAGSGKSQKREIKRLKKMEDGLGKIHDWDELRSLLEKAPSRGNCPEILRRIHKRQKKQAGLVFQQAAKLC